MCGCAGGGGGGFTVARYPHLLQAARAGNVCCEGVFRGSEANRLLEGLT